MTGDAGPAGHGSRRLQGALVGGGFGAAFLLANARTPLGPAAADLFRALAIVGLLALVLLARRARGRPAGTRGRGAPLGLFGGRHRLIVAAEAAVLVLGLLVIRLAGAPARAYLPWTVLVVGAHFAAFRSAGIRGGGITLVAAALVGLGLAGLVLAATAASDWIPLVSGVLSGLVLLAGSLAVPVRSALRREADDTRPRVTLS